MASIIRAERRLRTGRRQQPTIAGYFLFWLPLLFTGLALLQLGLVRNDLRPYTFIPLLSLLACYGAAAYLLSGAGDRILLPLTFFLTGLGLVLIERLAPAFLLRQALWLAAATVLLLLITRVPTNLNWLRRYKYAWLSGGLVLLAATLVYGVNPSGYGARLWLQVDGIYFQPSEPLKLLLVVFLAAYLADRRRPLVENKLYIGKVPMPHPSYFGPMFLMWGFSIVLLIWQRDLGAAFLFFGTFIGMLYLSTGERRYILAGCLLLVLASGIGYYLFDVVRLRVEAFINPWLDASGRSFQIVQSLLALASGGMLGQGLGQGLPTAIPVVHTDFVFAAIGEEYGFIGALAMVVLFALLVARSFHIALRGRDDFEQLLAAGIGTMLGLQTLVIMAGTLKLMPLTGVTLPLVSYGGSSLVTSFAMVGLLLFISSRPDDRSETGRHLHRPKLPIYHLAVARVYLVGFLIVAGGLFLWQVVLAPFLVGRADNPRPVIAEQQIRRGRLLTVEGVPLAETIIGDNGLAERRYPYADLASITGYYSLRYGTGGAEALFDPILRGTVDRTGDDDFLDSLLHRPLAGEDVTLTVNLAAQLAADAALGEREGAVVVLEVNTGAVVVMASHPTYDPNYLDATWETLRNDPAAPLVNRATQGLFPVGDLARLTGLIGLYEAGSTVPVEPGAAPLTEMLRPLGHLGYNATARQLGLIQPLKHLPSQPGRLPDFDGRGTVRDLAVTPLHLSRAVAALALDGVLPDPVLGYGDLSDNNGNRAISPGTVRFIQSLLLQAGPQLVGLTAQATPEETGRAWLSWFVGLAPAEALPDFVVSDLEPGQLILDPSQITTTRAMERSQAAFAPRYAVVAVVVTEQPDGGTAALGVARTALGPLLTP